MNNSVIGLFVGLLFALAVTTGGFSGLMVAVVFAAIGVAVGAHRDGRIDL
ncbi:MAG: DUF2273 domain-containing protein, partial [Gordonia sp. (in: high G+C Gram-positive bacteria)]